MQHLVYPTPGLSDTFYEEQMLSDKQGPTVQKFAETFIRFTVVV